jgi:hypothetical protein
MYLLSRPFREIFLFEKKEHPPPIRAADEVSLQGAQNVSAVGCKDVS